MSNEIKNMVNRFLGWRLPKDFSPDNGIKFTPFPSQQEDYGWPVGTNIFTADQAEAMLFAVAWPEIKQIQAENAALKEQVAQLEREKDYRYVEQVLRPIRILLKVAECAESMADNSEEMEGEDGRIHVSMAADFDELSDALDLLDELPDDKPNYVLGGAAKAAWALHDIIGDTNG